MKYINAAEILPEKLLMEIQTYVNGEILYVPQSYTRKQWGEVNGSRAYYEKRNQQMKEQFKDGESIDSIAARYGLALNTVKKIVYN